ncbi:hypothetical protein FH972_023601 [Carpinus fangiana]|uniref:Uncharacterized protein n=1 Tax=Carpinus fangiana TaxID=176857 RepID=A0A5N6KVX1_9ROSI|nr:hypothetical protein FH972_023601 [Carpinus fangiana]
MSGNQLLRLAQRNAWPVNSTAQLFIPRTLSSHQEYLPPKGAHPAAAMRRARARHKRRLKYRGDSAIPLLPACCSSHTTPSTARVQGCQITAHARHSRVLTHAGVAPRTLWIGTCVLQRAEGTGMVNLP